MFEMIKSSFLFNFRMGNVMVDTFVTGMIIMMSPYLFNLTHRLVTGDWNLMRLAWIWCSFKHTSSIVISGKKLQGSKNTRLEYSIPHQLKKLDCVSSHIHKLSEVPKQEPSEVNYSYEHTLIMQFTVSK